MRYTLEVNGMPSGTFDTVKEAVAVSFDLLRNHPADVVKIASLCGRWRHTVNPWLPQTQVVIDIAEWFYSCQCGELFAGRDPAKRVPELHRYAAECGRTVTLKSATDIHGQLLEFPFDLDDIKSQATPNPKPRRTPRRWLIVAAGLFALVLIVCAVVGI